MSERNQKSSEKVKPFNSVEAERILTEKRKKNLLSGEYLDVNHPAAKLSLFSAPMTNESDVEVKGAYASLFAAKKLHER